MSPVPVDTVLLRTAVVAALFLPLAGCGGDDPESASTPAVIAPPTSAAPTPSSPESTSPAAEPATPEEDAGDASSAEEPKEPAAEAPAGEDDDAPAARNVDTRESAAKASPKKASNDEIADGMKRAYDALKKEGFDPGKPIISGESSGALQIKETTIVFYASPRLAAEASARFTEALAGSPQHVKVARKANRLFLMSLPTEPTDDQLKSFRRIRQITNGAV